MINNTNSRIQYIIDTADETKKKFDFFFSALSTSDVKVVLDSGTPINNYNVELSSTAGGFVTFNEGFKAGTLLTIYRELSFTRQTEFRENQDFRASIINQEFNRMIMLLEQTGKIAIDSIRQPIYDSSKNMVLPGSNDRALKILGFDENGKPQMLSTISASTRKVMQLAGETVQNAKVVEQSLNKINMELEKFEIGIYAHRDALNLNVENLENILKLGNVARIESDGKLPISISRIPIRVPLYKSAIFFSKGSDGLNPDGVEVSSVWSLSDQLNDNSDMDTANKKYIELPVGPVRFLLRGGTGSGYVKHSYTGSVYSYSRKMSERVTKYSYFSGVRGGDTYFVYNSIDRRAHGGIGGQAETPTVDTYPSTERLNDVLRLNVSEKNTIVFPQTGAVGQIILNIAQGSVFSYYIGTGGEVYEGISVGDSGSIEVEYLS